MLYLVFDEQPFIFFFFFFPIWFGEGTSKRLQFIRVHTFIFLLSGSFCLSLVHIPVILNHGHTYMRMSGIIPLYSSIWSPYANVENAYRLTEPFAFTCAVDVTIFDFIVTAQTSLTVTGLRLQFLREPCFEGIFLFLGTSRYCARRRWITALGGLDTSYRHCFIVILRKRELIVLGTSAAVSSYY